MEKPNPMTPRPEGETMNDPIQVGGGFSTCSNCGEEYHNSISHDCPPASAPGGEDVSDSVFAALGHLSGTASAFGRGNATFENVESAAQGALTEIAAAVRRAAEQGRREVVALIVTANSQAIPHHSADWMNGFAAGQRAMRAALARGEGENATRTGDPRPEGSGEG